MIFQIFATIVLCSVIVYAYSQMGSAPMVSIIAIIICLCGEDIVLFPDHAIAVARIAGIGRGADLINYLWMLLSLVVTLNLHLKLRAANDRLVQLTRALALNDAIATERTDLTAR